jgi:hypothetical protein
MRRLPLVDRLRVRAPCEVGWENMEDRGTHRHCTKCESTVHDVAAMTRAEVETLLEARERGERVCLHLHVRRSDGAVLVADGFVERRSAGPRAPSRMVAAAMATATAMSACSTATSPPRDPQNEIAIAPVAPAPIETAPPPPPVPPRAPEPALPPPPPLPQAVEEPVPTTPVKPSHPAKPAKKIAVPSAKPAPPPKKPPHLDIIDGGAW